MLDESSVTSFESMRSLSVVGPVYDEEVDVEPLARKETTASLRPIRLPFEVVVVDDGSRDGTLHVLRDRVAQFEVRHRARRSGTSKSGIARTFEVILDMFTIQVLTWFRERPMRWFTAMGIPFLAPALLANLAVSWEGSKAVVPAAIALLAATSFLARLLLGRLAEFVLATAGPGARPLAHEFGEQP